MRLFIVYKIKLKFLISVNKRVCYVRKGFFGYIFQLPLTCAGQVQNGGTFECCKWIKVLLLCLLAIELKCCYETKNSNWQIPILLKGSLIEELKGCFTVNNGGDPSRREATKKNQRSGYCRILSKREASMFWVKISGRYLCPLIAYLGVSIELKTTKAPMMKKWKLAAVGFEPTSPKRLVPNTSALDQSATLPDALNIGPKHWKTIGAYHVSVLIARNRVVGLNGLK